MFLTATITEKKTLEKTITLPYYAKSRNGLNFYRVNKNGSVLSISYLANSEGEILDGGIHLNKYGVELESIRVQVLQASPATYEEVESILKAVLEFASTDVNEMAEETDKQLTAV